MIGRSNVDDVTASGRASALDKLSPPMASVAVEALAFLEPRLGQVLQVANEELFERAACESTEERRLLLESARLIRDRLEATVEAFALEFLAGFDTPRRRSHERREGAPISSLGDVEVLNGEAFDLSVAVSTVTSRSASKHKSYMERLMPALTDGRGSGYSSRRNPLSVFRLTGAFMTVIGRLALHAAVQRLLLDLFEREIIDDLGVMYRQACRSMKVDDAVDEALAAGGPEPGDAVDREDVVAVWPVDRAASGVEFDALRELIHGPRFQSPGERGFGSGRAGAGPTVSVAQLLEALSALRIDPNITGVADGPDLHALIGNALAEQGANLGEVEEVAQDTLQLVSMLFEHILHDGDLSIPVVSLISRLQIPVLKVALADPSLFDNADHVVRKVINRLADAGIGWWGDTDQIRREPLFVAIDRVVSRIVDECHVDLDVFVEAHDELVAIVGKATSRADNLEQRLTEREVGKVKVNAARRAVQDLVNSRASGSRLPEGVAGFIKDEWSKVMVYLCIRHGPDSIEWREAGQTFDELLVWGQPAAQESDVRRRGERLPSLLERVEHWLHRAGFQPAQAEQCLQELYGAFRELSEHDEAWFGSGSHYDVQELAEMDFIELVTPDGAATATLDPELEALLGEILPGTWVEFVTDGEPSTRCKLAIVFEQSRNHLFVDHRGLRVCEMAVSEVAEAIRDGGLRTLQADPVVERALDEMISDLRNSIRNGAAQSTGA